MTLTIALNSDIERRLLKEAAIRGIAPAEYAAHLIEQHLPLSSQPSTLAQMFAAWDAEDETSDPAEIARRNQEFEELKSRMNANRIESEGPNTRIPFPESD